MRSFASLRTTDLNSGRRLIRLARAGKGRAAGAAAGLLGAGAGAGGVRRRIAARSVKRHRIITLGAGLGAGLEDLVDRAALVTPLDHAQAGWDAERRRRLALEDLPRDAPVDRRGIPPAPLHVPGPRPARPAQPRQNPHA